ncbi:MAG: phytoene desaturase family protein [Carbonactinosporaceae bacterium]
MPDVVVVGAGHNALVAACYLAREGLDVQVVERDSIVGGGVSTVERFPGYRVDRGAGAHLMIRHTGIPEDLGLAECGLTYIDCDPWAFAPFAEGDLTFTTDLRRTCASIAATCGGRDADAYHRFVTEWGERSARIFTAFQHPPTPLNLGAGLLGLGRAVGLGPGGGVSGAELARQFLAPGDQLLDEYFTDERLKTALAWLSVPYGPPTHQVGTANQVGWLAMMHRVTPGRPQGGSGMLSAALAERFLRSGGALRLGDGAARITRGPGGGVDGVLTESGEHVPAASVLAGCHVLTTCELLGDEALLARARRGVRVGNGSGMAVRLGTSALPRYPGAPPGAHHGMQLLARSRAQLRRAYGDFLAGRPPDEPAVLALTLSASDPSIAPPGRHMVSLWGQWHPYDLATGEYWPAIAERECTKLIMQLDRVAPGFAESVEHVYVQTPHDIEAELGMRRGNVMHVEMGLDAMFALRPLPELAGYRTPVAGLYLTGASTHPGGGVFGASGRSAATVILDDRRASPASRATSMLGRAVAFGSAAGSAVRARARRP